MLAAIPDVSTAAPQTGPTGAAANGGAVEGAPSSGAPGLFAAFLRQMAGTPANGTPAAPTAPAGQLAASEASAPGFDATAPADVDASAPTTSPKTSRATDGTTDAADTAPAPDTNAALLAAAALPLLTTAPVIARPALPAASARPAGQPAVPAATTNTLSLPTAPTTDAAASTASESGMPIPAQPASPTAQPAQAAAPTLATTPPALSVRPGGTQADAPAMPSNNPAAALETAQTHARSQAPDNAQSVDAAPVMPITAGELNAQDAAPSAPPQPTQFAASAARPGANQIPIQTERPTALPEPELATLLRQRLPSPAKLGPTSRPAPRPASGTQKADAPTAPPSANPAPQPAQPAAPSAQPTTPAQPTVTDAADGPKAASAQSDPRNMASRGAKSPADRAAATEQISEASDASRPGETALGAPTTRAAEVVAAAQPEDARPQDRSAAMERPTTTSSATQAAALSVSDRPALGEEHGSPRDQRHERRSPSDAAQGIGGESALSSAASAAHPAGTQAAAGAHGSAEPAHPRGEERVSVVQQVAQKMDAMRLTNGRHEVTLSLRPEHLGDLHLTITADRDSVTARVVAQTSAARQAVEDGRDQLRAALEQKGFTLQGLDVSLGQGSADRRFQAFTPQPIAPPPPRYSTSNAAPAPAAPLARSAPQTRALNNGRLDYQA